MRTNLSFDMLLHGISTGNKLNLSIKPKAHIAANDFSTLLPLVSCLYFFIFTIFIKTTDGQNTIIRFNIWRQCLKLFYKVDNCFCAMTRSLSLSLLA